MMMQESIARTPISPGAVTDAEAARRVAEARRLFQRTLASWVSDLLVVRRDERLGRLWPNAPTRAAA